MLINYCHEYDRIKQRANGKKVADPEEQYYQLKAIEPQVDEKYSRGEISGEKYRKYKEALAQWEVD